MHAVEQSTRRRAAQATGWPVTAWLGRLKPDPLRGCTSTSARAGKELTASARASVPEPTHVQQARVDTAVRAVAEDVGAELSPPWAAAVRRASVARLPDLNDALDKAVTSTDLGVGRTPVWWRLVRVLQWVLMVAALVGGLWLLLLAVLGYLQVAQPRRRTPTACPCPRCCCSAASASASCWAWSARRWSACPRATRPAPPSAGCARRSGR